jgi:hypothetical protein
MRRDHSLVPCWQFSDLARCPTRVCESPLNGHRGKRAKSALLTHFDLSPIGFAVGHNAASPGTV